MTYRLATIIINFRTPGMTVECVETVVAEVNHIDGAVVVVVDNKSGDDSVEHIRREIEERDWAERVRLVESPVNGGFAAGNNVGIQAVEADNYLLLNSDTLVRLGAIRDLMASLEARPEVGLVGPRLEWPDGEPQPSCFRFRTPITEMLTGAKTGPLSRMFSSHVGTLPVSDEPIEPDWTSFACCLIRRSVIDQVGLLDEGYFMYFDDIDYCYEARKAGWSVLHLPGAHVVHLRGKSGPVKKLSAERKRRPAYFYASRNRYYAKVYGRLGLWFVNLCWVLGRCVSFVRELTGSKEPHTCEREFSDLWTNALRPLRAPHR